MTSMLDRAGVHHQDIYARNILLVHGNPDRLVWIDFDFATTFAEFGPEQLARCDYEIAIVKGFGEALRHDQAEALFYSAFFIELTLTLLKPGLRLLTCLEIPGANRPEDKTPPSRALRTLKIQPRNPLSRCQSYPHRHDITSLSARCALLSGAAAVYHVESSFHSGEMVMGINMMIDAAISESQKPGNVFKHFGFSSVLGTQHRNLMQHDLESRVEECLFLSSLIPRFFTTNFMDAYPIAQLNQTRISLNVIQEALKRFSLNELSLSYNGGKDCLVMLILFLSCLHPLPTTESLSKDGKPTPPPTTIPAIYAQPHHPFRSVEEFVASSSHDYHLSLVRYTTDPPRSTLRTVFASYLDHHPQIRAIFVGTRRTDPHGEKLTHFDHTDHGWPGFMRIHPVVNWHYAEIWAFIRHLGIEY
ncbi:hypothetical protein HCAG_01086 [Histoplasma mississippiense (nom. inval.)]|uniref:hypothetical protein n=1 Tax=Ajellomyces capsulatus (strain NAm1 / WU24) TaxID=2059318 RepID=UPI000157B3FB|nr:hypothetical protein HCAG_01086 [Histoplasma mississippiense (nom. inval.)]EDN03222.1 hypothetical protein HCAG_01086 [Histoplasma mississippiense (nom. inval.)]